MPHSPNRYRSMSVAICVMLVVAIPRLALACPVCFGQADAPLAKATNLGIIVMLAVVCVVLIGFAAFFVSLGRRANRPQC